MFPNLLNIKAPNFKEETVHINSYNSTLGYITYSSHHPMPYMNIQISRMTYIICLFVD